MLQDALKGKSELAAQYRLGYSQIERKEQLRCLASRQIDEHQQQEVITFESIQFGMDLFNDIQSASNFTNHHDQVDDYSLYCHNYVQPLIEHCQLNWEANYHQISKEQHFQDCNSTKKQLQMRKLPENYQGIKISLESFSENSFDLKESIQEHLTEGHVEDLVSDMILAQMCFDLEHQSDTLIPIQNPKLGECNQPYENIKHTVLLEEEILNTRKQMWDPITMGYNPKSLVDRIVYEAYQDEVNIIESHIDGAKEQGIICRQIQSNQLSNNNSQIKQEGSLRNIESQKNVGSGIKNNSILSSKDSILTVDSKMFSFQNNSFNQVSSKELLQNEKESLLKEASIKFLNKKIKQLKESNSKENLIDSTVQENQMKENNIPKLFKQILEQSSHHQLLFEQQISKTVCDNKQPQTNMSNHLRALQKYSQQNVQSLTERNTNQKSIKLLAVQQQHNCSVQILKLKKSQSPVQRDIIANQLKLDRIINKTLSLRNIRNQNIPK